MRKQETNDFVVDTIGHCFICMEEIPPQFVPTGLRNGPSASSPICSMQYVSRYLKLKLKKAFQQEDLIPENLLTRVEKSILKVSLCKDCAGWNAKISELLRHLEKIEIEAASYVQLIHDKLKTADEDGKSDLSSKLVDNSSGLIGKLQIADALRKETANKCSQKIRACKPKIKIKKLAERDLLIAKGKLKQSSSISKPQQNYSFGLNSDLPIPETKGSDFQLEHDDLDETTSYMNNDYADDLEDQNMNFGEKCLPPTTDVDFRPGLPVNIFTSKLRQEKYARNPNTGKFKCSLCPREFASAPAAHVHYRTVHLKVRFQCNVCNQVFTQTSNLKAHQRNVHLKRKLKCDICGHVVTSKRELTLHRQTCFYPVKIDN